MVSDGRLHEALMEASVCPISIPRVSGNMAESKEIEASTSMVPFMDAQGLNFR